MLIGLTQTRACRCALDGGNYRVGGNLMWHVPNPLKPGQRRTRHLSHKVFRVQPHVYRVIRRAVQYLGRDDNGTIAIV